MFKSPKILLTGMLLIRYIRGIIALIVEMKTLGIEPNGAGQ
ncbi:hypothetical protein [Bacillus sp. OK048]|nr:hypothetical protein [Bacillus sp. OK048]